MTYSRTIDTKKKYSKKQIEEWESICAMKDASKPFPENMASGWFWDWWTADITGDNNQHYSSFSLQLNFQKKSVIDRTVRRIFERAKNIMAKTRVQARRLLMGRTRPNGGFLWKISAMEASAPGKPRILDGLRQRFGSKRRKARLPDLFRGDNALPLRPQKRAAQAQSRRKIHNGSVACLPRLRKAHSGRRIQ